MSPAAGKERDLMELVQLKYFRALAETENLTQTARKLHLSAPALSESISKLERELGIALFDRPAGKSLRLNDKGRILLAGANQIFDILDHTQTHLQNLAEAENASVFLAVASPLLLQDVFVAFRKVHPEIRISHVYLNLRQLEDETLLRQFDFLVAPPEDIRFSTLRSVPLYDDDEPMLAVYPEHPFAQQKIVDVQELRGVPFIALGKDISSRKMFDSVFAEAGFEPNILYECDHLMREALIRQQEGIGLTTLYTHISHYNPSLVYVPLTNCSFRRKQSLFWNKHRSQTRAAVLFQAFATDYYRKLAASAIHPTPKQSG